MSTTLATPLGAGMARVKSHFSRPRPTQTTQSAATRPEEADDAIRSTVGKSH